MRSLLNQLRAAQLKMRETEIAHAKQKIAYESEYDRAEALRRWPWLRSRVLGGTYKIKYKALVTLTSF